MRCIYYGNASIKQQLQEQWRWSVAPPNQWDTTITCIGASIFRTLQECDISIICRDLHGIYQWVSSLIRKMAVAHAPGMSGTFFFPPPRVSNPGMPHGTCMTHVPWCMPGSLASGFLWSQWRKNVPGIPGACATHNFIYLVRGQWVNLSTIQFKWEQSCSKP